MKCEDILLIIRLTYFLTSSIITMESQLHDTIMDDCLREIDWNRGKLYTYRTEDYDFLMRSPKLFARKFSTDIDNKIIEQVCMAVCENEY